MAGSTDRIEGMDDLLADLAELESLVTQQRIIGASLRRASSYIADGIALVAPRESGKLADSIKFTITDRTPTSAMAKIGPSRFYGGFTNWGTKHIAARRWLDKAFDARKEMAIEMIRQDLAKKIASAQRKQLKAKEKAA